MSDVVLETKYASGLYPLKNAVPCTLPGTSALTTSLELSPSNSYDEWHKKLGHILEDRYPQLSHTRHQVPTFSRSVPEQDHYIPFFRAKMRKGPVKGLNPSRRNKMEDLHDDLSGPIPPSLGGNVYAAHFIEPTTAVLDIVFLKNKDKLVHHVCEYISRVESLFSAKELRARRIGCDNAK